MTRKPAIVALILLALGGAWIYHRRGASLESAANAVGEVFTVKRGSIEQTVEATGNVAPLNRVEIKPTISGRIDDYLVDEGSVVASGQTIAWMSSSDRAAIMDAARSQGPAVFKQWQDAYKPTPIVAPISGIIILRNIVAGQMVDPTMVLFAISDRLIVLAQVDESDIGKVKIGMPARINLDAYPDKTVEGRVFDILHEGVNNSNVIDYTVKVDPLPRAPSWYRSQMTAEISFIIRKKTDVLLVPSIAVRQAQDGTYHVWAPGPDGKPIRVPVSVGIQTMDQDEIVSGLTEGQKILLSKKPYVPQAGTQSSPLSSFGKKNQSHNASH